VNTRLIFLSFILLIIIFGVITLNKNLLQDIVDNSIETENQVADSITPSEQTTAPNNPQEALLNKYTACLSNKYPQTLDPTNVLFELKKELSSTDFTNPTPASMEWYVDTNSKVVRLNGININTIVKPKVIDDIHQHFIEKGFEQDDIYNSGSATVSGYLGYYKDCVVCKESGKAVDSDDLSGDYNESISCAFLK